MVTIQDSIKKFEESNLEYNSTEVFNRTKSLVENNVNIELTTMVKALIEDNFFDIEEKHPTLVNLVDYYETFETIIEQNKDNFIFEELKNGDYLFVDFTEDINLRGSYCYIVNNLIYTDYVMPTYLNICSYWSVSKYLAELINNLNIDSKLCEINFYGQNTYSSTKCGHKWDKLKLTRDNPIEQVAKYLIFLDEYPEYKVDNTFKITGLIDL